MSKKLYIGIISGILIGISIPVLIRLNREEDLFADEDLTDDNEMLDRANHQLLHARKKVSEMIADASVESESILDEAGKILSLAKEKAASIHFGENETTEEQINKIKREIEMAIEEISKKLK